MYGSSKRVVDDYCYCSHDPEHVLHHSMCVYTLLCICEYNTLNFLIMNDSLYMCYYIKVGTYGNVSLCSLLLQASRVPEHEYSL